MCSEMPMNHKNFSVIGLHTAFNKRMNSRALATMRAGFGAMQDSTEC